MRHSRFLCAQRDFLQRVEAECTWPDPNHKSLAVPREFISNFCAPKSPGCPH